jgi:hypothetical protein
MMNDRIYVNDMPRQPGWNDKERFDGQQVSRWLKRLAMHDIQFVSTSHLCSEYKRSLKHTLGSDQVVSMKLIKSTRL